MDYNKYLDLCNRETSFITKKDLIGKKFCLLTDPEYIDATLQKNKKFRLLIDVDGVGKRRTDLSIPQFEKILLFMKNNNITYNQYFIIQTMEDKAINKKCKEKIFTFTMPTDKKNIKDIMREEREVKEKEELDEAIAAANTLQEGE